MAVLQGARLRTDSLPAADAAAGRVRAAAPATVRTPPRSRPMGLLLAGIVAATMLGLAYLTQTLGANATTSEIGDMEAARSKIYTQITRDRLEIENWTERDAVVPMASEHKLKDLGSPVVLTAPDR